MTMLSASAEGQAPGPPGPWVIDVRGTTGGLPSDTAFFPTIPVETLVPARGFGLDLGGHVYLLSIGPARLGVGGSYLHLRGTTPEVTATVRAVAPQVSFNFGSRNGWSYLGAGLGRASVRTTAAQLSGTAVRESGGQPSINVGGGARWFLTSHVGVGFDLRWHRISGPAKATVLAAAAGFSVH